MDEKNQVSQDNSKDIPEEPSEDVSSKDEGKIAAILAYVPFLCFYALFIKRDNPYAFHHGKQGLVIFIVELAAVALRWDVLWNAVLVLCAAVAVWGMIAALRGETFRLPVISDLLDQYQP